MILNPQDYELINTTKKLDSKLWLMSLNGKEHYCNPSVENIAKEIFLAMMVLFNPAIYPNLKIHKVTLYETPNCYTHCIKDSISNEEAGAWMASRYEEVTKYALDKGVIEYDDRKA